MLSFTLPGFELLDKNIKVRKLNIFTSLLHIYPCIDAPIPPINANNSGQKLTTQIKVSGKSEKNTSLGLWTTVLMICFCFCPVVEYHLKYHTGL